MKDQYAEIVAGCLAAFDSLKRGETHERANKMMTRTAARDAAFYPLMPILNPLPPRPNNRTCDEDSGSWYDGMSGRFGLQRND